MRLAYKRYSGPSGYTAEQFRPRSRRRSPALDLSALFRKALETTDELDYDEVARLVRHPVRER